MANDPNVGPGRLQLEPSVIPRLRRAFQSALDQLQPLAGHAQDFVMTRPAMADEASTRFQAELNQAAAHGAQQIREYRTRLESVLTQLGQIQRAYDHNEQRTAAELSRQLQS